MPDSVDTQSESSDEVQNQDNSRINNLTKKSNREEANLNRMLHDKLWIDEAYNVDYKTTVPDLNKEQIEQLSSKFENLNSDNQAQGLYDYVHNKFKSAYNAVQSTITADSKKQLDVAILKGNSEKESNWKTEQLSGFSMNVAGQSNKIIGQITQQKDDLEKGNLKNYHNLVSELNFSAQSYNNFDGLSPKRDSEYYKLQESIKMDKSYSSSSSSSVSSVEEITNNTNIIRQDSSDIMPDVTDMPDIY